MYYVLYYGEKVLEGQGFDVTTKRGIKEVFQSHKIKVKDMKLDLVRLPKPKRDNVDGRVIALVASTKNRNKGIRRAKSRYKFISDTPFDSYTAMEMAMLITKNGDDYDKLIGKQNEYDEDFIHDLRDWYKKENKRRFGFEHLGKAIIM